MSIIIMNLLVGLAVDDIASVMRVATVKRLEMRVKLTLDVERQLPRRKFFSSIRRSRTSTYQQSHWQKLMSKVFRIELRTAFDRSFSRLEKCGLIQTAGNQDQKGASTAGAASSSKLDDDAKSRGNASGTGATSDWITNTHSQITAKYNEFNRHMADLKTQQEKINNVLQQLSTGRTSRHSSHLAFAPTTA